MGEEGREMASLLGDRACSMGLLCEGDLPRRQAAVAAG